MRSAKRSEEEVPPSREAARERGLPVAEWAWGRQSHLVSRLAGLGYGSTVVYVVEYSPEQRAFEIFAERVEEAIWTALWRGLIDRGTTLNSPMGLTRREHDILAFERQWWKYAGAKEEAIKELFAMSATRYYQV